MARNDEWCEFCEDRLKSVVVERDNKQWSVCSHCASLSPGFVVIQGEENLSD